MEARTAGDRRRTVTVTVGAKLHDFTAAVVASSDRVTRINAGFLFLLLIGVEVGELSVFIFSSWVMGIFVLQHCNALLLSLSSAYQLIRLCFDSLKKMKALL